jgi:hypothetical protein
MSLIGLKDSSSEIVLETQLQPGQNIFSINKDLKQYISLKITYALSGKELEIKF